MCFFRLTSILSRSSCKILFHLQSVILSHVPLNWTSLQKKNGRKFNRGWSDLRNSFRNIFHQIYRKRKIFLLCESFFMPACIVLFFALGFFLQKKNEKKYLWLMKIFKLILVKFLWVLLRHTCVRKILLSVATQKSCKKIIPMILRGPYAKKNFP